LFGEQRPPGHVSALHEFRGTRTVGASAVLSSNPTKAALEDKGDPGRLGRPLGAVPQVGPGSMLPISTRAPVIQ
jgi:hypothetical protein